MACPSTTWRVTWSATPCARSGWTKRALLWRTSLNISMRSCQRITRTKMPSCACWTSSAAPWWRQPTTSTRTRRARSWTLSRTMCRRSQSPMASARSRPSTGTSCGRTPTPWRTTSARTSIWTSTGCTMCWEKMARLQQKRNPTSRTIAGSTALREALCRTDRMMPTRSTTGTR